MKKIVTLFLALLMLLSLFACGAAPAVSETPAAEAPAAEVPAAEAPAAETPAAETPAAPAASARMLQTIDIADLNGKVKLLGRAAFTDRGLCADWSANGFEFTADCEGDLSFNIEINSSESIYYTAFVDGVEIPERIRLKPSRDYVFITGIEPGVHTISIVHDTDVYNDELFFKSMTLNCDPATIAPTADKALFIEFVGTSITSGSGVLGKNGDKANRKDASSTHSYAYQTTKLLDADCSLASKGSMGVMKEKDGLTFPTLYPLAYGYRDLETKYVYAREPDICVLEIGPNDHAEDPDTVWIEAAEAFCKQVRAAHPNAKIVIPHAIMSLGHAKSFPILVEKLGGAEAGFYEVTCKIGNSGRGRHPNIEEAFASAEILADFIKNTVLK